MCVVLGMFFSHMIFIEVQYSECSFFCQVCCGRDCDINISSPVSVWLWIDINISYPVSVWLWIDINISCPVSVWLCMY